MLSCIYLWSMFEVGVQTPGSSGTGRTGMSPDFHRSAPAYEALWSGKLVKQGVGWALRSRRWQEMNELEQIFANSRSKIHWQVILSLSTISHRIWLCWSTRVSWLARAWRSSLVSWWRSSMVWWNLSKSAGSMFWPDCSIPIFARMDPYGDTDSGMVWSNMYLLWKVSGEWRELWGRRLRQSAMING